jgi:ABC-type multidrug transport system fused ATPase/permease subunit
LSGRDRRILTGVVGVQAVLSVLDLIGVALLGIVVLLATSAITGDAPDSGLAGMAGDSGYDLSEPRTITALAVVAGLLLIGKSLLSYFTNRRVYRFLARRQARVSTLLAKELLSRGLLTVQSVPAIRAGYALTQGVSALILGVIGSAVMVASEMTLVVILLAGLAVVDLTVTVFAAAFFALVGLVMQRLLSRWAERIGSDLFDFEVTSTTTLREAMRAYREYHVYSRLGNFLNGFSALRWRAAEIQADAYLMNMISKYVYEIALIVGAGLLAAFQLSTSDWSQALAVLAIFLAGASRILPSLMRMQQSALQIRSSAGQGEATLDLVDSLGLDSGLVTYSEPPSLTPELTSTIQIAADFIPKVELSEVTFRYPNAGRPALLNLSLNIAAGSSIAIVGPSGSGKSTLADLILGALAPSSGGIKVGGLAASDAVRTWPGRIAYVPQDSVLIHGSICENVAIGVPRAMVDELAVWSALRTVGLEETVSELSEGLTFDLGEDGDKLSGGQKQRIGLARALYSTPGLIVLDEATSSLDADSEGAISDAIRRLGSDVTRIIIAHRLATVQSVDMVAYIAEGRLIASGSFNEVRAAVPDFDRQAALMGIADK